MMSVLELWVSSLVMSRTSGLDEQTSGSGRFKEIPNRMIQTTLSPQESVERLRP